MVSCMQHELHKCYALRTCYWCTLFMTPAPASVELCAITSYHLFHSHAQVLTFTDSPSEQEYSPAESSKLKSLHDFRDCSSSFFSFFTVTWALMVLWLQLRWRQTHCRLGKLEKVSAIMDAHIWLQVLLPIFEDCLTHWSLVHQAWSLGSLDRINGSFFAAILWTQFDSHRAVLSQLTSDGPGTINLPLP